jgi:hypothetical protein
MAETKQYLLLIRVDEELAVGVTDTDPEPWIARAGTRRLEGHQLRGPGDATLVRDAGTLVTDGPFAETKEEIAGYDVLDWDGDLAGLVELAASHPVERPELIPRTASGRRHGRHDPQGPNRKG